MMTTIARRGVLSNKQVIPLRFRRPISSSATPKTTPSITDRVIATWKGYTRIWETRKSISAKYDVGDKITIRDINKIVVLQGQVKAIGFRLTTIIPYSSAFAELKTVNEAVALLEVENHTRENTSYQHVPKDEKEKLVDEIIFQGTVKKLAFHYCILTPLDSCLVAEVTALSGTLLDCEISNHSKHNTKFPTLKRPITYNIPLKFHSKVT